MSKQKIEFEKEINECLQKYESKKSKYSETWKEMDTIDLFSRLWEEIEGLEKANNDKEINDELTNIINVCLMIKSRLKNE